MIPSLIPLVATVGDRAQRAAGQLLDGVQLLCWGLYVGWQMRRVRL